MNARYLPAHIDRLAIDRNPLICRIIAQAIDAPGPIGQSVELDRGISLLALKSLPSNKKQSVIVVFVIRL